MTKVFRILQLKGLGLPQGEIASSCAVSKSTVSKVLKKASELGIALPLSPAITEEQITQLFLQSQEESSIIPTRLNRVLPDFDYIRKELKRSGVTKKRLWTEYCAKCSASGQKPFMYFPSSVILYNRTRKNTVQLCILSASPVNRLK